MSAIDTITTKLYKLMYDPYTQLNMFLGDESAVVWNIPAVTKSGESVNIELTANPEKREVFTNPFQYGLFFNRNGYQRLHWDDVATIDGIAVNELH